MRVFGNAHTYAFQNLYSCFKFLSKIESIRYLSYANHPHLFFWCGPRFWEAKTNSSFCYMQLYVFQSTFDVGQHSSKFFMWWFIIGFLLCPKIRSIERHQLSFLFVDILFACNTIHTNNNCWKQSYLFPRRSFLENVLDVLKRFLMLLPSLNITCHVFLITQFFLGDQNIIVRAIKLKNKCYNKLSKWTSDICLNIERTQ